MTSNCSESFKSHYEHVSTSGGATKGFGWPWSISRCSAFVCSGLPMDYLAQMSLIDTQEVDFISVETNPEL